MLAQQLLRRSAFDLAPRTVNKIILSQRWAKSWRIGRVCELEFLPLGHQLNVLALKYGCHSLLSTSLNDNWPISECERWERKFNMHSRVAASAARAHCWRRGSSVQCER